MNLIRDCLDKRLIDRDKRPMGRVDGIVFELKPQAQPRVAFIEVGLVTRADRLARFWGRLVGRLIQRSHVSSERYQIPWRKITVGLNEVRVDVRAESTPALAWELWLREHIIGRIPGAHGK